MSLAKPERKARKYLIPKMSINAHGVILSMILKKINSNYLLKLEMIYTFATQTRLTT